MKADNVVHEFMLLPNFHYAADGDIKLGSLMPRMNGTKARPDPSILLNRTSVIQPSAKSTAGLIDFHFDSDEGTSNVGGVSAESGILPLLSASLNFEWSRTHSLTIDCPSVDRHIFEPTDEYVARVLRASPLAMQHIKQYWRPSCFLVTGLMIGHDPAIQQYTSRGRSQYAMASVDLTAGGGPVKPGVNTGRYRSQASGKGWEQQGRFIIAYRLHRIRLMGDGTAKDVKSFNRFALMDDGPSLPGMDVDIKLVAVGPKQAEENDESDANDSK